MLQCYRQRAFFAGECRHSHPLFSIGLDLIDSSEHFRDIFAGILGLDICYSSSQALEGILARGAESARSSGRHFASGWNILQRTRGKTMVPDRPANIRRWSRVRKSCLLVEESNFA